MNLYFMNFSRNIIKIDNNYYINGKLIWNKQMFFNNNCIHLNSMKYIWYKFSVAHCDAGIASRQCLARACFPWNQRFFFSMVKGFTVSPLFNVCTKTRRARVSIENLPANILRWVLYRYKCWHIRDIATERLINTRWRCICMYVWRMRIAFRQLTLTDNCAKRKETIIRENPGRVFIHR